MRISDWSSDVCSSDLVDEGARFRTASLFLASWIFSRRCLLIELPHPARDKCRGHRESRPRGKNIEWLSRPPNVGWESRRALTRAWCAWSADHIRRSGADTHSPDPTQAIHRAGDRSQERHGGEKGSHTGET